MDFDSNPRYPLNLDAFEKTATTLPPEFQFALKMPERTDSAGVPRPNPGSNQVEQPVKSVPAQPTAAAAKSPLFTIEITSDRVGQTVGSAFGYNRVMQYKPSEILPTPSHPGLNQSIAEYQKANSVYGELLDARQKRQLGDVTRIAKQYDGQVTPQTLFTEPKQTSLKGKLTPKETQEFQKYFRFGNEKSAVMADGTRLGQGLGFVSKSDGVKDSLVSPNEFRGANKVTAQNYLAQSHLVNSEVTKAVSAQELALKGYYRGTLGMLGGSIAANYLIDQTLFSGVNPSVGTTIMDFAVPFGASIARAPLLAKGLTIVGLHTMAMWADKSWPNRQV